MGQVRQLSVPYADVNIHIKSSIESKWLILNPVLILNGYFVRFEIFLCIGSCSV